MVRDPGCTMTNVANEPSGPPLRDLLALAEAAADIQRLLFLDRMWTVAGDRIDLADEDRKALADLGDVIAAQVTISERHARNLHRIYTSHPEWINQRVRNELATDHFTDEQRAGAARMFAVNDTDFAARAATAADAVARQAPAEREELEKKAAGLRGDGPALTDISQEFACSFAGSAMVAELVLCPETFGLGCAAAVVIYVMADQAGC
jgi:hypothetical protein